MPNRTSRAGRHNILFYTLLIIITALFAFHFWLIDCRFYAFLILWGCVHGVILLRGSTLWTKFGAPAICLAAFAVCFAALVFTRPDLSTSLMGSIVRESVREVSILTANSDKASETPAEEKAWKAPEGYSVEYVLLENAQGEWLKKEGGSDNVILQLHGGSYRGKLNNRYRDAAVKYSRRCSNASVFSLDYRTYPQTVYPGAIEDALDAYEYLLAQGVRPENIIIAGDSAGGNLALALTLRLRDGGGQLPAALILMSPWADMTASGESYRYNLLNDPMYGITPANAAKYDYDAPPPYAGKTDLADPYLSPVYADFNGFPPMLIQVGTYEVLESNSLTVAQRAEDAGVQVTLTRYDGMWHVFQMFGDYIPEARDAWEEAGEFAAAHFAD